MTITLPAPGRSRLRPVRYEPVPGQTPSRAAPAEPPVRSRPPRGHPPGGAHEYIDAHRAATRIVRLALEVLDGKRALMQLEPHFAASPLRYWRVATGHRAAEVPARHGRLRICTPCPGVAEVAVTCRIDGRYRALAARLERTDDRWRCTAVRLL